MTRAAERPSGRLPLSRSQRSALALVIAGLLAGSLWMLWPQRTGAEADVTAQAAPAAILVDVNRADWPELSLVPGLGKAISQKIVEHRRTHGAYRSLDELIDVDGIGPLRLEDIRPFLTLGDGSSEQ